MRLLLILKEANIWSGVCQREKKVCECVRERKTNWMRCYWWWWWWWWWSVSLYTTALLGIRKRDEMPFVAIRFVHLCSFRFFICGWHAILPVVAAKNGNPDRTQQKQKIYWEHLQFSIVFFFWHCWGWIWYICILALKWYIIPYLCPFVRCSVCHERTSYYVIISYCSISNGCVFLISSESRSFWWMRWPIRDNSELEKDFHVSEMIFLLKLNDDDAIDSFYIFLIIYKK